MKHYLILLLMLRGLISHAQTPQPTAIRMSRTGDVVKITDATGATIQGLYPANDAFPRNYGGKFIELVLKGASEYYTPDKFLNASGTAYGSTVATALSAYNATLPTGAGGGGASTASFGTAPVTTTRYTNTNSGTIATTGIIYMLVENVGTIDATITYGSVTIPLPVGGQREYPARLDASTNKYVPYPVMSIQATGTGGDVILYKTPTQ